MILTDFQTVLMLGVGEPVKPPSPFQIPTDDGESNNNGIMEFVFFIQLI